MDIFQSLTQSGASGIVIYLVARPLVNYLIESNRKKDEQILKLIQDHFEKSGERHEEMIRTLHELPDNIVGGIKKVYRPELYGKTDSQLKRIRNIEVV